MAEDPVRVHITRSVPLPDPLALERWRRLPHLGPRLLFFSGGTALRDLSRALVPYTHNSIHLITPFDSGGSSAEIRRAFRMLSVGDLRNRLLALADQSIHGQPEIFRLFAYRLPSDGEQPDLRRQIGRMIDGADPMVTAISDPLRKIVQQHLRFFADQMPNDFDLRGANIGNLILAGGYLNQDRHIDSVIFIFSRLVEVRGVVRPVADEDLHLVAELENGEEVIGQHRLTGKEVEPLTSPVRRLTLSRPRRPAVRTSLSLHDKVRDLIQNADLICFPMGSFYTSLIANLLPTGVGQSVAETDVPKVFVPNAGHDPEQIGLSLADTVERLLHYLQASCDRPTSVDRLLHFVIVDRDRADLTPDERRRIEQLGPKIIEAPLTTEASTPLLDPQRLADLLLSMA